MAQTETRRAAEKLDNAYQCYAHDNGDGFGGWDYQGAYDYREEGYRIGEEASDMAEEDREEWIDGQTYAFPESARYLIACAADFRVAELEAQASRQAMAEKVGMTVNFASAA